MNKILTIVSVSMLFVSFARAGDLLTYKKDEGKDGFLLYLDKSQMRVDVVKGSEPVGQSVLFSKDRQEAVILNHKKKEAIMIDDKTIAKIAEMSKKTMEMMKSLPPEMQKMMKEKMGMAMKQNSAKGAVEIKKTASGVMIGKWKTTQFEILKQGKKESDVWSAPLTELGLDKNSFDILKDMGAFYGKIAKDLPMGMQGNMEVDVSSFQKLEGVPVKAASHFGSKDHSFQLETVESKKFSATDFAVPADYQKKSFGKM